MPVNIYGEQYSQDVLYIKIITYAGIPGDKTGNRNLGLSDVTNGPGFLYSSVTKFK